MSYLAAFLTAIIALLQDLFKDEQPFRNISGSSQWQRFITSIVWKRWLFGVLLVSSLILTFWSIHRDEESANKKWELEREKWKLDSISFAMTNAGIKKNIDLQKSKHWLDSTKFANKYIKDSASFAQSLTKLIQNNQADSLRFTITKERLQSSYKLQKQNLDNQLKTLQTIQEISHPLFPFSLDIDFRRDAMGESQFIEDAKQFQQLLTQLQHVSKDSLPPQFRIYPDGKHLAFTLKVFGDFAAERYVRFASFYSVLQKYIPMVALDFFRDTSTYHDKYADPDRQLLSKSSGDWSFFKSNYQVVNYNPTYGSFDYSFRIDTFENHLKTPDIISLYSIANGYMRVRIGNPFSEAYTMSLLELSSASGYNRFRYDLPKFGSLNDEPHGPIKIRGREIFMFKSE